MNEKPLRDIKVVNLAINLPGPAAAALLAERGARVTKVEPPGGDPFEGYCPAWYRMMRQGQTVLRVDLRVAEGRAEVARLLEDSDVVIASFRPSVLARYGLDWTTLHSRYPRLCQVSIVGYPSPHQERSGHDLTYQAQTGVLCPPSLPRTFLADMACAERAASHAVTLLYSRERGDGSGSVELPISECAEYFAQPVRHGMTGPGATFAGAWPRYNLYETREGWIAIALVEAHFWQRFRTELGIPGEEAIYEELRKVFVTRSAADWEALARSLDLPIIAVR